MKAKHVLMAMTLPIAFAACTEDEIVKQNNASFNNLDRPVVGEVSVVLGNEAVESMTRLANPETNAQDWSTGNLGACLMDEMKPVVTGLTGLNKYTLSNKVYTDYPFNRVEKDGVAAWETTGYLLEGNYFFYYTNSPILTRDGFQYEIQDNQKTYENEEFQGYKPVTDNQLWVSYQGFVGGKQLDGDKIELNLAPAHQELRVQLVYNGDSEMKINKVELIANNGTFATKGYLDVENATLAAGNNYLDRIPGEGDAYTIEEVALAADAYLPALFNVYNDPLVSADQKGNAAYNPMNVSAAWTSTKITTVLTADLNDYNISAAAGKKVAFSMVVPNSTADDYTMKVYTDKGIVTYAGLGAKKYKKDGEIISEFDLAEYALEGEDAIESVSETQYWAGQKDAEENYVFEAYGAEITSFAAQESRSISLSFTNAAVQVEKEFDIEDYQDLELYLGYHDFQNYAEPISLPVEITANITEDSEGILLTKKAYDLLVKNDGKFRLTINASSEKEITISGEEGIGADAFYTFDWGTNVSAIVAEGANQTINKSGLPTDLSIKNEGSLTINNMVEEEAQNTQLGDIYNVGTLNVKTPVTTSDIYNGSLKDAPEAADIVKEATATIASEADEVHNWATADISAVTTSVTNNETGTAIISAETTSINNTGKVTLEYNATDVTNNAGATLTLAEDDINVTVVNSGELIVNNPATLTLTNNEDATAEFNANVVLLEGSNAGEITQNAKVNVDGDFDNNNKYIVAANNLAVASGKVFNNGTNVAPGTLEVKKNAKIVLITDNTYGTVVLENRAHNITIGQGQEAVQGVIEYTATEAELAGGSFGSQLGDKFNKLIVNKGGDFTGLRLANSGVTNGVQVNDIVLDVAADADVYFKKGTSVNSLVIGAEEIAEEITVALHATTFTISSALTVKENVYFFVNSGMTINYSGTKENLVNGGEFYFGGMFNASCEKPDGVFNGTGSNYTWL